MRPLPCGEPFLLLTQGRPLLVLIFPLTQSNRNNSIVGEDTILPNITKYSHIVPRLCRAYSISARFFIAHYWQDAGGWYPPLRSRYSTIVGRDVYSQQSQKNNKKKRRVMEALLSF